MDELQKFENWINENCYMNGGRLQVYGTIRGDVATYYKENQAKNNEVLDLVSKRFSTRSFIVGIGCGMVLGLMLALIIINVC